jgi:hypothetical protein
MNIRLVHPVPEPIEIDQRPCELCGLKIDRHDMVDDGEGPEFFCADLSPDEMTLLELERRAELRRQEDIAEILAAMPDCPPIVPRSEPEPYCPAASTVAAFRLLIKTGDAARAPGLAHRPAERRALSASAVGSLGGGSALTALFVLLG